MYHNHFIQTIYEGEQLEYHDNGQLKEKVNFKNGRQEGELLGYFRNGQLAMKEFYINGDRDGECLYYHENGQISSKILYQQGIMLEEQCFDENGITIECFVPGLG
ncbi:MAG: hypothetical protein H6600_01590 [Flavobacteriales bacterium]|nr:hypothetical protein [Flavobacteriales bacterium]